MTPEQTVCVFTGAALAHQEGFYFWAICLMAVGGFLLGFLAVLLMWRIRQENRVALLEFRVRHEALYKKIKAISKALNLPEDGTKTPPELGEKLKGEKR